MKTIITAILIIVAVAAVLFILPFAIMFFSYVFGIEMCIRDRYNMTPTSRTSISIPKWL